MKKELESFLGGSFINDLCVGILKDLEGDLEGIKIEIFPSVKLTIKAEKGDETVIGGASIDHSTTRQRLKSMNKEISKYIQKAFKDLEGKNAFAERVREEAKREDIKEEHVVEFKRYQNAGVCTTYDQYLRIKEIQNEPSGNENN